MQIMQISHTGKGLKSVKEDPNVLDKQSYLIEQIKSNPKYGKKAFSIPDDALSETINANGPSRNFVIGLATSNQAFLMVHTATLSATNTKISEDGVISITWKVDDQFDYLPAWSDHNRDFLNYWAYNLGAEVSYPIYYGLLGAKKQVHTNAYWRQTKSPSNSCERCR